MNVHICKYTPFLVLPQEKIVDIYTKNGVYCIHDVEN